MLLASGCFQQFGIVALGPLVQLFAGRVEGQSCIAGKQAGSDVAMIFLQALSHHLLQFLLVGHNGLCIRIIVTSETCQPLG